MAENADRTESVFAAAAALASPDERASYLDLACAGDAALRERVAVLLRAHDRQDHLLDRPVAADPHCTLTYENVAAPGAGALIAGRYKLLEEIGEGGMGTVWVAEQSEPVRRRVALKLIKAGMDSRQVLSRFEAERQALALMDHPNIAKVFDGGMTDQGRPFFVMEYVKGLPITRYCDEARLTIAERLALFSQVCQAVQHAHQKGIIHRDLKPSNILVCLYDGVAVPKVIDFGLAKAMHQSLTENTLYTAHGMMVGTPLYMSPEQAEFNNLDIDTRADIYSLGVILYELLTGTTPLEKQRFKQAAWQEMLRLIKEEEPPRPSTRLSSADTLASVAASRQSEPAKLTRLVRGELDWIVLKALEKDRRRRYETATGFAADVQRYLADEPVQACPPSTAYRFGKFARRNKLGLATASLLSATLLAAVVVLAVSNVWVRRERDQKDQALREKTAALAEAQASAQQARRAVDEMLTEVGERTLSEVPEMREVQMALLEKALGFQNEFLQRWGDTPELRHDAGLAHRRVGQAHGKLGRRKEKEEAYQKALEIQESLVKEFPDNATYIHDLSTTYVLVAGTGDNWENRHEVTKQWYRKALALREKLVADYPDNANYRLALMGICNDLRRANIALTPPDHAAAEVFGRRAVDLARQLAEEFPQSLTHKRNLASMSNNLGSLYGRQSKFEEAARWFAESLAAARQLVEHPQSRHFDRSLLAMTSSNLGATHWKLGQRQAGEEAMRLGVSLYEKEAAALPSDMERSRLVCESWYTLGDCFVEDGRPEEAERAYRRALGIAAGLVLEVPEGSPYYFRVIDTLVKFTKLLEERGRQDEAAKILTETVARVWKPANLKHAHPTSVGVVHKMTPGQAQFVRWGFERYTELTGIPHPRWPDMRDEGGPFLKVGLLLAAQGQHRQAAQSFRRCIEIAPGNASGYDRLARLLANCPQSEFRDVSRAVELSRRATELLPKEGLFWNTLGIAQYRAGQWQPAVEALNHSMSLRDGGDGLDWIVMAMAQWRLGNRDDAQNWLDKAAPRMEMQGRKDDEARRLLAEAAALLKAETTRKD